MMYMFKAAALLTTLSMSLASASSPPEPTITAPPDLKQARGLFNFLDRTCAGVLINTDDTSGCCVGGTIEIQLSSCDGWPICKGDATIEGGHEPISCASVIDPDDDDYTSKVEEASRSMEASGTVYHTVLGSGSIAGPGVTHTGNDAPRATGGAKLAALAGLVGAAAFL